MAVVVAVEERRGMAAAPAALAGAAVGGASQVAGERSLLEAREQGRRHARGGGDGSGGLGEEEAVGSARAGRWLRGWWRVEWRERRRARRWRWRGRRRGRRRRRR